MGGKRCHCFLAGSIGFRAVLQLLYTGTDAAEWLFPQEKATLHDFKDSTLTGEML
jgi:hypothetical protein